MSCEEEDTCIHKITRALPWSCRDVCVKRDLVYREKRPSTQGNEGVALLLQAAESFCVKRDLVYREKRSMVQGKETYYTGKETLRIVASCMRPSVLCSSADASKSISTVYTTAVPSCNRTRVVRISNETYNRSKRRPSKRAISKNVFSY